MQRIQKGTLDPTTLRPALRRKMVLMLVKENSTLSNAKIGALVGLSDSQVGRVRRAAIMGTTYDIDTEVRHLVNVVWLKSVEYQRREVAAGNARAAWAIFKESIELLQGLGFVFEAPKKIALAHFQGQGDFQEALRSMFDDTGVPALPEFVARLRQLSAGGNGGGNGRVIDLTALVERDPEEGEPGGDPQPPRKEIKD
jgi:hypothetical protein